MEVWARQRRRIESVEGENIRKCWATVKELFVVYSVIDDIFVNRNKNLKIGHFNEQNDLIGIRIGSSIICLFIYLGIIFLGPD